MKTKILTTLLFIFILASFLLPRVFFLDQFVTPDEPKWLVRSANFFEALVVKNFANTYQKGHPGVTVMWAGAVGFLWKYPDYVRETPTQQPDTHTFHAYLENRGHDPLDLLTAGREMMLVGNLLVFAVSFLCALRLFGPLPSIIGFVWIAFDPFSIALSRLLHMDGLMGALMFLSLIAFINYLYRGRHFTDLLLAGFGAGLSWLTKSPSLFLIPFMGLLCILELGRSWWSERRWSLTEAWSITYPLLAWGCIAVLVFVLLWPAMWVDPIGSLQKIFEETINYAEEGHESGSFFNGEVYKPGDQIWLFYPVNYLWRTTPPILIGLLLSGFAFVFRQRLSFPKHLQKISLVLLGYALLFTLFMTLGTKKFDRYLIPVFAPLTLVAVLGWYVFIRNAFIWIISRWRLGSIENRIKQSGMVVVFTIITAIQLIGVIQTFPYYFSYYNPLMGGSRKAPEVMMVGWGEGLEQAAHYLNAKPDSDLMVIQSWYPSGPFSYFSNSKVILEDFPENPQKILRRTKYVVVYVHQFQRQLPSKDFVNYFEQQVPEHIIYLNGLEYVRIYRKDTLTSPSQ